MELTESETKALSIFGQEVLTMAEEAAKPFILAEAPKFIQYLLNAEKIHPGFLGVEKFIDNEIIKLATEAYVWAGGEASQLPTAAN